MRDAAVALAVAAALVAAASAGAHATGRPLVYGYPYAAACPGAGIADRVDRFGMYECNCTSYVAWALHANGRRTDWFVPGAMDAWNWPHVARLAHLRVDTSPTVGSVAVWPKLAPPFGHVAYVVRVRARGSVDVAEYNYPAPDGESTYAFGLRTSVPTRGAVFIHVPPR